MLMLIHVKYFLSFPCIDFVQNFLSSAVIKLKG